MAEIHVEKKRGMGGWVWVLILVVVLAAVGVYLWQAGYLTSNSLTNEAFLDSIAGGYNGV